MKQSFKEFANETGLHKYNIWKYQKETSYYLNSQECVYTLNWLKNHDINLKTILKYLSKNQLPIKYDSAFIYLILSKQSDLAKKYENYFKDHLKVRNYNIDKIDASLTVICLKIFYKINLELNDIINEDIFDFLNEIIIELLVHEKKSFEDIKYITSGTYSTVFQIGNKVIKIGKARVTFNILNHRRFLKPLLRMNIYSKDGGRVLFCIEITEKVSRDNLNRDDVYEVYKDLRDSGIVWPDDRVCNVGRLIRDNKIYFSGINHVDRKSTGYLSDNNEILEAGELVVLDNDPIFDEKTYSGYCGQSNNRYLREKQKIKTR